MLHHASSCGGSEEVPRHAAPRLFVCFLCTTCQLTILSLIIFFVFLCNGKFWTREVQQVDPFFEKSSDAKNVLYFFLCKTLVSVTRCQVWSAEGCCTCGSPGCGRKVRENLAVCIAPARLQVPSGVSRDFRLLQRMWSTRYTFSVYVRRKPVC